MPETYIVIDIETRSRCDLKKHGAYQYTRHETTEVICARFTHECDGVSLDSWEWRPGWEFPDGLRATLRSATYATAHNAAFDRDIYKFCMVSDGFPEIPDERWYCTSAQCRVNALPAGLDNATRAIDAKHKKDHYGSSLIRQLSIPRPDGNFCYDPDLIGQMSDYCERDVAATVGLLQVTRRLQPNEHNDWLVNERINARGVRIDRELAGLAIEYADDEILEIGEIISALTEAKADKHTLVERIKDWMHDILPPAHPYIQCMRVYKDGVQKFSLDKHVRAELLDFDLDQAKMPADCYEATLDVLEVVDLVDTGNKSSVAKFRKMLELADPKTDRVHGAFMFAGAGQTLRFSSRGLQLHNFPRACAKPDETQELMATMRKGEPLPGEVMPTLASLLRPALIPAEGHVFIASDWSAIEARVLPWLAQDPENPCMDIEAYLDKFYDFDDGLTKKDVYVTTAESVGFDSRDLGKVLVLALGFGGSVGAFLKMGGATLGLAEHEIKAIVTAWRKENAWAVRFWKALKKAAIMAVAHPGQTYKAGRVAYTFDEGLLGGTLICCLPGGHFIQYPKARIEVVDTPFGTEESVTALKASRHAKADAKEWPRVRLWHGVYAENVTQAFAAALLRDVLTECEQIDVLVVAHTHDEILAEVKLADVERAVEEVTDLMNAPPKYAEGLPLRAIPKIMPRYGK